jgi:hypothetical protein
MKAAPGFVLENAGIKREAITAWVELKKAQDQHETYPCKDNPYFYVDYSDQNEQRVIAGEEAEKLCYGCPLLKACYDFANANKEEYGIWGGINFGINEEHLW